MILPRAFLPATTECVFMPSVIETVKTAVTLATAQQQQQLDNNRFPRSRGSFQTEAIEEIYLGTTPLTVEADVEVATLVQVLTTITTQVLEHEKFPMSDPVNRNNTSMNM